MIRTLPPDVQQAVIEAFARSVAVVFLWAIPFAVVAFLLVLGIPELPLRDTAHIGAAAVTEQPLPGPPSREQPARPRSSGPGPDPHGNPHPPAPS